MRWLYLYLPGSPRQSALERRLAARVDRETSHRMEFWDWGAEHGIDFNPGPAWTEAHRGRLTAFHQELRRRCAEVDAVLIAQTGAVPPDLMAELPCRVVYNTADDPDASATCSFPYLQAAEVVAHAGTRFSAGRSLAEELRARGARHTVFFPLGFHEEEFPALVDVEAQLAHRPLPLVYVGHLKRGKLERLMRRVPALRVHSHSLRWKHHLYLLATAGRWVRPWTRPLAELYHQCQVGINIHFTHGPSNARSYQLCAAGVAQVMDCPEGIPQLYRPGVEVLGYADLAEAEAHIHRLLEDRDLRVHMALAGYRAAWERYPRFRTLCSVLDQVAGLESRSAARTGEAG